MGVNWFSLRSFDEFHNDQHCHVTSKSLKKIDIQCAGSRFCFLSLHNFFHQREKKKGCKIGSHWKYIGIVNVYRWNVWHHFRVSKFFPWFFFLKFPACASLKLQKKTWEIFPDPWNMRINIEVMLIFPAGTHQFYENILAL